jgi:TATA-box binding protein (TBP) (component of TFIID and TFIIIB)
MLCAVTEEERTWEQMRTSIVADPDIISKPLSISTITSIFKSAEKLRSVQLAEFVAFLTCKDNKERIDKCVVSHLGQRFQLSLKTPGGGGGGANDDPGSTGINGKRKKRENRETKRSDERSDEPSSASSGEEDSNELDRELEREIEKELGGGEQDQDQGSEDFYNQLTLSFRDQESNKSIKIFNNLTLHVTGCKSPIDARIVATFAWDMLSFVYPQIVAIRYEQQIQMMNATCEVSFSFNLAKLTGQLKKYIVAKYDPVESKYPGAIGKYPVGLLDRVDVHNNTNNNTNNTNTNNGTKDNVTIMMFASGNVTFSSKSLGPITEAYTFFTRFVDAERANVQSKEVILSKKRLDEITKKRKYTLSGPRKNSKTVNAIVI